MISQRTLIALIVFFVFIAAGAAYKFLVLNRRNAPTATSNNTAKSSQKLEVVKTNTQEPQVAWKKLNGLVTMSPACIKSQQPVKEITLTPNEIYFLYRNHRNYSKSILLDPFRFCLKVGDEVSVHDLEPRGKIKIIALELVQINPKTMTPISETKIVSKLPISTWVPLAFDFLQSYNYSPIYDSFRLGLFMVYEFVEKKDFNWELAGSRRPPLFSGVKYINKKNISQVTKDELLVDVRSKTEFARGTLPNAVNRPFIFKTDEKTGITPNPLNIQKSQWAHLDIPFDKNKPIILFGQDIYDLRSWAAYIFLNMLKYQNIGWVLEGYAGIQEGIEPRVLPVSKYPLAVDRILTAKGILAMVSKNPKMVYVGSQKIPKNQFASFVHIPYFEINFNPKTLKSFKKKSNSLPDKANDRFYYQAILTNKSEVIIITDYDDANNRPLKAALWLEAEGYQNVYVYPFGLNNLSALNAVVPEKINCLISGDIKQCQP